MYSPKPVQDHSLHPQDMWWFDGTDWVSAHLYSFTFTKKGNLNNGSYYKIGDVDGDATQKGLIEEPEVKIEKATLIQQGAVSGTVTIVSNAVDVDTFTVLGTSRQAMNANLKAKITGLMHFSVKWNGARNIKDSIFTLYYRKVKP